MLKRINFKKILIIIALVFVILFSYSFMSYQSVIAFVPLPFGGKIIAVLPCVNGLMLTVGPPRGGTFMFMPGSILYSYYQIYRPGPWVLGSYSPGGACILCSSSGCVAVPTSGTIIQVGTSL